MGVLGTPRPWIIEWSDSLAAGKRVALIDPITGRRVTGHHWDDWDLALQQALSRIDHQGDLVTEVERYLRNL